MPVQMLTCRDCGDTFAFDEWEQQSWTARGWPPPIRCRECRVQKSKAVERRQETDGEKSVKAFNEYRRGWGR